VITAVIVSVRMEVTVNVIATTASMDNESDSELSDSGASEASDPIHMYISYMINMCNSQNINDYILRTNGM